MCVVLLPVRYLWNWATGSWSERQPKVGEGLGLVPSCPSVGKTLLGFSKHLVFSLLIKSLGQRDKGQWNAMKSEWQFGLYAFFFPFY